MSTSTVNGNAACFGQLGHHRQRTEPCPISSPTARRSPPTRFRSPTSPARTTCCRVDRQRLLAPISCRARPRSARRARGNWARSSRANLEQSTVDIATELTNMIVAQRGYEANSQMFKAGAEMMSNAHQTEPDLKADDLSHGPHQRLECRHHLARDQCGAEGDRLAQYLQCAELDWLCLGEGRQSGHEPRAARRSSSRSTNLTNSTLFNAMLSSTSANALGRGPVRRRDPIAADGRRRHHDDQIRPPRLNRPRRCCRRFQRRCRPIPLRRATPRRAPPWSPRRKISPAA